MDTTVSNTDGRWSGPLTSRIRHWLSRYGRSSVDLDAPDRNNDALRKAKYLVR
jgi:hypothetical protein